MVLVLEVIPRLAEKPPKRPGEALFCRVSQSTDGMASRTDSGQTPAPVAREASGMALIAQAIPMSAKDQQGPQARGRKDGQPSQQVHQEADRVDDCPDQSRL